MVTFDRRQIMRTGLWAASLGLAGLSVRHAHALTATPAQTEGPFYPREVPRESDADLTWVNGQTASALGTVTEVSGRVLSEDGRAMTGVRVEIWQCDVHGRYHYLRTLPAGADPNFQGYGETVTDGDAAYAFRTIRPVPYGGRTPHIHFAVSGPGFRRLTTQMYVEGEPMNDRDGILGRVRDPGQRAALIVPLHPHGTKPGALVGRFDLVLGQTLFG
jgi:protocatechuate 3,4-dioxygenase beta subunit